MRFAIPVCVLILVQVRVVSAQASVEYGANASRAAITATQTKGLGKSISNALENLDKTSGLDKAGKAQPQEKTRSRGASQTTAKGTVAKEQAKPAEAAPAPVATPVYEDLKNLEAGLSYEDLVRRFGPPTLEMAGTGVKRTLTYQRLEGFTDIEIENGKVLSIKKPMSSGSVTIR